MYLLPPGVRAEFAAGQLRHLTERLEAGAVAKQVEIAWVDVQDESGPSQGEYQGSSHGTQLSPDRLQVLPDRPDIDWLIRMNALPYHAKRWTSHDRPCDPACGRWLPKPITPPRCATQAFMSAVRYTLDPIA